MKNKITIIALFGKSGAGKDTIQQWLLHHWDAAWGIVSCTTRPKRDYEQDGIDYHFITVEDFTQKTLNGDMLEATSFNDWFYGTPIDSLKEDKINIGVFNIEGINCLIQDDRLKVIPIYIAAGDKTRLLRNLNREQSPNCYEICRRFMTDEKDFRDENVDFDFYTFWNEDAADYNDLINFAQAAAASD